MSAAARAWIGCVLLAGAAALVTAIIQTSELDIGRELADPALWIVLVGACLAHAFPVIAPRHQAYHATQALLMVAVMLLSWPAVALIVVAAHIAEWLRRPRPAYIQLYNVAVYLLSCGAALLVLRAAQAKPFFFVDPRNLAAAFAAAAVLLVLNHGLTAVVLWLARGVPPVRSGLFGRESLGVDGMLLVVGIAMAVSWQAQPLTIVATAAPLVLIYRALRLANMEAASHRDQLTGLYNTRHFVESLELELARSAAAGRTTGLMVLVIDDTPGLIQRSGRASLDFLLVAIEQRARGVLRAFDLVARVDDGALAVLQPDLDDVRLASVAERTVAAMAAQPFLLPTARDPISASISAAWLAVPGGCPEATAVLASVRQAAARAELSGPGATLPAEVTSPASAPLAPPAREQPASAASVASRAWVPPRSWLVWYEAIVIGLGLIASLLAVSNSRLPDLPLAAGVVGLVLVSELLAFELYDQSSFSVSFAPVLAAGLLGGPAATVIATLSVALLRGILRRTTWHRVAFNAGGFTLLGVVATVVATGGGRLEPRATQLAFLAISTAVASAVYFLHSFLVAGAIALDLGADPRQIWTRNYRWLFPHYLLLGWMGLGLAVATVELGPLGTALFLAPPLAMRIVLKQYVERTSGAVQRLEQANTELRNASSLLRQRGEELALLSDLGQLVVAEPRSENLPALVVSRCVPALGDVCLVVWQSAQGVERSVHADARAADTVRSVLELCRAEPLDELVRDGPLGWTARHGGTWLSAPLSGGDQTLGALWAWCDGELVEEERARRQALMREVAQRLALVLERDVLLEEAAEVDALRAVDRAKSDFIATTAHELRTPLTSLQGYTELLRNDVDPELRERWLGIVHVEAAQLGQVVDQLLDVSRLDSGRFQAERREFELADVVHSVVDHFGEQASLSGHTLEVQVDSVPPVYADPAQIERVLRNLLSNALKYSPAGGPVRIAAASRTGEVEVCVEDRGLGIPPEWADRLFERFQRVERPERASIRGTGLGLYIARQLVELNAGRIWVTSEGVGKGAIFHFTVPRARLLAARNRTKVPPHLVL